MINQCFFTQLLKLLIEFHALVGEYFILNTSHNKFETYDNFLPSNTKSVVLLTNM
jgi:hypothetical protein